MLPTPDTSHVPYSRVYEPSEDSFLLLDTLASPSERAFLRSRFPAWAPAPLVVEVGTGSGVVLAFVTAHAGRIFGTGSVLTAGVDVNAFACRATEVTVGKACALGGRRGVEEEEEEEEEEEKEQEMEEHGLYLGSWMGDLGSSCRPAVVDVLVFNPPYVPTPAMPVRPEAFDDEGGQTSWEGDSYLLGLAYAGGRDGMETTTRLVSALPGLLAPRGCAYLLLCAQNRPDRVREDICGFGPEWRVDVVGSSGKTAGWERLQVLRIWREG
ncbi:hypothetical protein E4U41_002961 [Claviceps citrina]|nr:hypothetical protein E4U41_002961 [Claviceps citrina]